MYNHNLDFNVKFNKPKDSAPVPSRNDTHKKEWFSLSTFCSAIDEYCTEGSLHGLKYLRNPKLCKFERMFWLIIFSFSVYFSVLMTRDVYEQMKINQVEMTYNPISTPIWDIPFPGIMICSAHPVRKSLFDLENPGNRSDLIYYSKVLCPEKESFGPGHFNITIDEDFFRFVHEAAIPCERIFKSCVWNGKKIDCCVIFKPVVFKSGQCYIFNEYPGQMVYTNFTPAVGNREKFNAQTRYWHIATGYPSRVGNKWKSVLPLWSEHRGEEYGLTVTLQDTPEEHQVKCSKGESLFTVHVFSPLETGESGSAVRLSNGFLTRISLNPSLVISPEDIRKVPLPKRGCYLPDEGNLKYFKDYSHSSCLSECLIYNVLNLCNCVPFDLRRIVGAFNHKYCTETQMMCLAETLEIMSVSHKPKGLFRPCECLPLCSTLYFEYETRSQRIVLKTTKPSWAKGFNKSQQIDITQVSVFYSQSQFSAISRVNTASFSAFMGNAGGLLGLFLGFSIMSGFEILYFALVKPTVKVITFYCKRNKVTSSY